MAENADLRDRTQSFAVRIIHLVRALPRGPVAEIIGRQLLRSGTSVGSNYRSARRAKSTADFINKLGTVEEESDEAAYWMELLVQAGLVKANRLKPLQDECNEITAMIVAAIVRAKRSRG